MVMTCIPVRVPVYAMVEGDLRLARIVCVQEKDYMFPKRISCTDMGGLLNIEDSIRVSVGENTPLCIVEDELGVVVVYYPPRGNIRVFDNLAECLNTLKGIAPGSFGKVCMPDIVEDMDLMCIETLLVNYSWDFKNGALFLATVDVVPNGHACVQGVYTGLDVTSLVNNTREIRRKVVASIINGFTLAVLWVDGQHITYRLGERGLFPSRRFQVGVSHCL